MPTRGRLRFSFCSRLLGGRVKPCHLANIRKLFFGRSPAPSLPIPRLRVGLLFVAWIVIATLAFADPPSATRDLRAETLALRTALYQDPLLESPLQKLLSVYREANRLEELLAMYRTHLARFPKDAGSTTVLRGCWPRATTSRQP